MIFFELLRISLGLQSGFSELCSDKQWEYLYNEAKRQALSGICFAGIKRLKDEGIPIPRGLYAYWLAEVSCLVQRNERLDTCCCEISKELYSKGFHNCVLKGQGTAILYPGELSTLRQCGDIDIWTDGGISAILDCCRSNGYEVRDVNIKHADVGRFKDVEVEVHFRPTWFYDPMTDRKLRHWMEREKENQFENQCSKGFSVPTISFNIVYSLIHIYRHLFDEGIGLRQVVDYYFILQASTEEERKTAYQVLCSFGMGRFCSAMMWVLKSVFCIENKKMLCEPAEKDGNFLLSEIMQAGNFGHFDARLSHESRNLFESGWQGMKRNIRFLKYYPREVCWAPLWKVWHYGWRKWHGYK